MQFSSAECRKAENEKSLKDSKSNLIIVRGVKSRSIALLLKSKWDMITWVLFCPFF